MRSHYDVVVIGGGPVGATLALDLQSASMSVLLLESRPGGVEAAGVRPLALSYGSRLILERLQVWPQLKPATPIARIHVSHRGRFGRAALTAHEAHVPALGYVVDYAGLLDVLDSALGASRVSVVRGARVGSIAHDDVSARIEFTSGEGMRECLASLVVIAEGAAAVADVEVETIDYKQSALTGLVEIESVHDGTAYERFTPDGPLALLPFGGRYALVWTLQARDASALEHAPSPEFLAQLRRAFGDRVGRFVGVSARATHPLALRVAGRTTWGRAVLVGNAAQSLHPVAGQGFNLGLRDAWELGAEVRRLGVHDRGLLERYAAKRRLDRAGGVALTDGLIRIFSSDFLPLALARGAGLTLLDSIPPLKNFFVRRMMFGTRG